MGTKLLGTKSPELLLMLGIAVMTICGCRAAGYEIIDPVASKPTPELAVRSLPPSARLEIVQGGSLIGVVRTGQGLTFRPSSDTVDPDYVGKSPCSNPGISAAKYDISIDGKSVASAREKGCEPLEIAYAFQQIGAQNVTLKVTSADGETATASQVIRVINSDPCCSVPEPAIYVTAAPLVAYPSEEIQVQARCIATEAGTITWKFGDGANSVGGNSKHSFSKTGQYVITATCTLGNGKTAQGTVTVSVIPNGRTRPSGGLSALPGVVQLGMPPAQVPPNQSDPSQN